jgi:23S rRNA-/tRNA-specific pseudouridylate synthase
MLAAMWNWQVSEFESGHSLLDALSLRVPAAPRAFLSQLIRKGRIRCDHTPATLEMVVRSGMPLSVLPSARFEELVNRCGIPPQSLLYEDRFALVIDKPAGVAMHQTDGHDDNLVNRVARFIAMRHAAYLTAPIHRLDIGTSGPVLFGKGRWAIGQFGRLMMDGRIGKHYLALVTGPVPAAGELTTPVIEQGAAKPSLSRYRRLVAAGPLALLELELVTGRQHQARQQLAAAGWPIVGDRRYGGATWPGLGHPFLHCLRLQFPALAGAQLRQVVSPLPDALVQILAAADITTATFGNSMENPAAFAQQQV